ncbi:Protein PEPT-1, partial [Aphelenchoides avenae]
MDGCADADERTIEEVRISQTWRDIVRQWPKRTLLILTTEFCERYSFFGMRTILTLYFLNVLKFNEGHSTAFFNGFAVLCYTTPILGSIIADGYIGKFKTILAVSVVYACGQVLLAISATRASGSSLHPWLDITALVVIAFGTGGIKPCVASFGADQFPGNQPKMLSIFFSVFYFAINAG